MSKLFSHVRRIRVPLFALGLGLVFAAASPGQEATAVPVSRELSGIREVRLEVDPLDDSASSQGITPSQIGKDIEARLVQEGIAVNQNATITLRIDSDIACADGGLCTYNVRVDVREPGQILRTGQRAIVTVWTTNGISGCMSANLGRFLKTTVHEELGIFIEAWRAAQVPVSR